MIARFKQSNARRRTAPPHLASHRSTTQGTRPMSEPTDLIGTEFRGGIIAKVQLKGAWLDITMTDGTVHQVKVLPCVIGHEGAVGEPGKMAADEGSGDA